MKTLSNKEMASGLNVAPARVSEWEKRGMPMTSIEAAAAWRRIHAPARAKRSASAPQTKQEKRSGRAPGHTAPSQGDGWEARLERTRQVERQIFDSIAKAIRQGDVTLLARLQSARAAALREIRDAEQMAVDAQLGGGDMLRRSDAEAVMVEVLRPLREALDKLPLNERTNCNPERPEVAQRALTEWRDRLMVRANAALSRFRPVEKQEQISAPVTSENG
jgi:hypothetical protein